MRANQLSFYGSLLLSRLADQVMLFLVPLVAYQQTGSASRTGMASFVETLTRFVAFPDCGVLGDRHPSMRLLRQSQALRALTCIAGLAAGLALSGQAALADLVLVSAACGVFTTQGVMAREVLLPWHWRAAVRRIADAHGGTGCLAEVRLDGRDRTFARRPRQAPYAAVWPVVNTC